MLHTPITADPAATRLDAPLDPLGRAQRHDGWTPERQRAFLELVADGATVEQACRGVGLAVSSAYAFRRRAAGAAFALAWRAALLLARDRVADELMTRALDGQIATVTRPDGTTVERHHLDNRLALALLARLDRQMEAAPADPAAAAENHAARLVAQDFDAFLDLVDADASPARAGLFLARRTGLAGAVGAAPELEPVLALARADRYARTGAATAEDVDIADLDPACRADWTAGQWARAEAAGLLRLAPPDEAVEAPPLPPLMSDAEDDEEDEDGDDEPVWWDDTVEEYRTSFPPPADEFVVGEMGKFGDLGYQRALTRGEVATITAVQQAVVDRRRAVEGEERDAWFAAVLAQLVEVMGQGNDKGVDAASSDATGMASAGPTGMPDG